VPIREPRRWFCARTPSASRTACDLPDAFGGPRSAAWRRGAPGPPALRQQPASRSATCACRTSSARDPSWRDRGGRPGGVVLPPAGGSRTGGVLACLAEVADAFSREQQEDEAYFRLLHAVLGLSGTSRSRSGGALLRDLDAPVAWSAAAPVLLRALGSDLAGAAGPTIAGGRRALPPLCSEPRAGKRAAAAPALAAASRS